MELNQELQLLEGSVATVQGKALRLRFFVLGDHMLQYKLLGADGPGSSRPERQACPYCAEPPDVMNDWRSAVSGVVTQAREGAPLQAIHRLQCIPDGMHGAKNILYGVAFAVVRKFMLAAGEPGTEVDRVCSMGLQKAEEWTGDGDDLGRKDIRQCLEYWTERKYEQMFTDLQQRLPARQMLTLRLIFQAVHGMVRLVYKDLPLPAERQTF